MSEQGQLPSYPGAGDDTVGRHGAVTYASWGRRAGAFVLDGFLVMVVAIVITGLTHHHQPWDVFTFHTVNGKRQLVPIGSKLVFYSAVNTLLGFAYATWFLSSSWQATPFMRLLGIYIATEQGGHVTLGRAAGRTAIFQGASFLASRVPFGGLVILVDLLWPLWDSRNQTIHDKLARTIVLRRPAG